jgi:hypothetical protein
MGTLGINDSQFRYLSPLLSPSLKKDTISPLNDERKFPVYTKARGQAHSMIYKYYPFQSLTFPVQHQNPL